MEDHVILCLRFVCLCFICITFLFYNFGVSLMQLFDCLFHFCAILCADLSLLSLVSIFYVLFLGLDIDFFDFGDGVCLYLYLF